MADHYINVYIKFEDLIALLSLDALPHPVRIDRDKTENELRVSTEAPDGSEAEYLTYSILQHKVQFVSEGWHEHINNWIKAGYDPEQFVIDVVGEKALSEGYNKIVYLPNSVPSSSEFFAKAWDDNIAYDQRDIFYH